MVIQSKNKGNGKFITENRSTAYDEIAITGFLM
jgi:hypothetical protein